jgi:predicted HTH transcriptional regulator
VAFGTERLIQSCVPGYLVDCVLRRDDIDRYDDRLMVRCNLIEAFDQITGFIAKHTLDRFFVVDGQRTGVRNLYKYTRLYSGQDPQLIEGDVFETVIPLGPAPTDGRRDGRRDGRADDGLSGSARVVLDALRADPGLTSRALAKATGISPRQVTRILGRLRESGHLRREGSSRWGTWVVPD